MFYATAGQQATQQPPSSRGSLGATSGAPGGYPRGGPPGLASRGADPNDFPALGSHAQHSSSYAAQAQPSIGLGQSQPPSQASSQAQSGQAQAQAHLSQQQQLYLQQQQQQMGNVPPPPPPGIPGPNPNSSAVGSGPGAGTGQANGVSGGDEFPALSAGLGGDGKDIRLANYLRQNPSNPSSLHQGQPSSPTTTLPNGSVSLASASQSTNATPSTNPPHPHPQAQSLNQGAGSAGGPPSTADSSWPHRQPSPRPNEPVVRPVQQILSSPVDKWGLKALLYEIQMHMNKTDRGMLVFGDELEDLGVDVNSEEALYPSFVTPWADPNSLSQPSRIEETYHIPQCYHVHAPPVSTKLANFAEDTLFLAFFMSPQDVVQLEVAEELYARGWRYHTEIKTWITSPQITTLDLESIHSESEMSGKAYWIRGPFLYLDSRTWTRQRTMEDFTVDACLLEITRPAAVLINEDAARKESSKSSPAAAPPTSNGPNTQPVSHQGQPYQL